ncbi:MAG: LytR family transcriptional regulator [Balneolaceae bacterium]|nr:LytR family transcriptional regulator [Balneolaceae bacterium]
MAKNDNKGNSSGNLFLNAAIGFLSVLLLILVAALFTRLIYPRIFNERAETNSELISEIIQIEVLNGCGVPGIANAYTGILRTNGFDVVETGNFETFDMKETIVISRSGIMDNAYRVADALGISRDNVIRETSSDFYLDVTVVLGKDYKMLNTE